MLGVFLTGAYQEILGDLHNLFGDTNAVHIRLGPHHGYEVTDLVHGDTVTEVLNYVQFRRATCYRPFGAKSERPSICHGRTPTPSSPTTSPDSRDTRTSRERRRAEGCAGSDICDFPPAEPCMSVRFAASVFSSIVIVSPVIAQSAQQKLPERAVRRDIPMTNMIRKAHAAGTRDSSGRPGRNYWQLATEYTINAKFDAPTAMVSGHERVVIHNNSPDTLRTIQLRLDQNLFAANVPKAEKVTEVTDGLKLSKLTIDDETVNLAMTGGRGGGGRGGRGGNAAPPAQSTISGADVTSASLALSHWIMPHGSATMEADWSFKVPRSDGIRGIRMGSWGDSLYQVAQWYPRVAVYDDLRGWDTDPYLGPSEFYNNFGHFDYTLDMPAGWLVGASGLLQNPEQVLTPIARERLSHALESDSQRTIVGADERGPGVSTVAGSNGRVVWHFVADSVADVAWATSDRFVFDATRANIPGKGYIPYYLFYEPGNAGGGGAGRGGAPGGGRGRGGAGAADSVAVAPPSYRGPFDVCVPIPGAGRGGGGGGGGGGRGFRAQGATGRHALEFYSKLWMPYAFPILQQVDGPEGGMEYPMFIMAAGSTDHETGHQWWPMMVGVNETWYGFMDEGFNQYMNHPVCSRSRRYSAEQ